MIFPLLYSDTEDVVGRAFFFFIFSNIQLHNVDKKLMIEKSVKIIFF